MTFYMFVKFTKPLTYAEKQEFWTECLRAEGLFINTLKRADISTPGDIAILACPYKADATLIKLARVSLLTQVLPDTAKAGYRLFANTSDDNFMAILDDIKAACDADCSDGKQIDTR